QRRLTSFVLPDICRMAASLYVFKNGNQNRLQNCIVISTSIGLPTCEVLKMLQHAAIDQLTPYYREAQQNDSRFLHFLTVRLKDVEKFETPLCLTAIFNSQNSSVNVSPPPACTYSLLTNQRSGQDNNSTQDPTPSYDDNLTDSLQRFWETESIGIKNDTFSETQTTEFLPEIHFDKGEGRYEVNLPWKPDCFPKSTGYARPDIDSPSINECLQKGPNLIPPLFDTIIKFRSYPVGIVSDIEQAFHQVQISPSDRCMLGFFWFDDIRKDNPTIKRFQFQRLVFGLTPSPAILSTVIQNHLSQHDENGAVIRQLLKESLYVDDFAG
ncbi:Hypothetical predicted protein, partial [Paramuricea clavata]